MKEARYMVVTMISETVYYDAGGNEIDRKTEKTSCVMDYNDNPDAKLPVVKKEKPKRTTKKFVKPTVEQIAEYCVERHNKVDANKFFNYYESNGWIVGKSPMKDWQAAVRTWERNNYGSNYISNKSDNPFDNIE